MRDNYYAIIMAGGVGSRLWPVSTTKSPKQFHDITGIGKSLLKMTFERISKCVPEGNILVITNALYTELVKEELPSISGKQILSEPSGRNTAPCILYASKKIYASNPKACILVSPCDHWISDNATFADDVEKCLNYASENSVLITMGIKPDLPHTGYGYIKYKKRDNDDFYKVTRFIEKPDKTKAQRLISEQALWNSGIFAWSAKSILESYKALQPSMYHLFEGCPFGDEDEIRFLNKNYPLAESISVDYAILEKAENTVVKKVIFSWNDLGSWVAIHNQLPKDNHGNVVINIHPELHDANNNIISETSSGKRVVVVGLSDFVIADTPKALLICPLGYEKRFEDL